MEDIKSLKALAKEFTVLYVEDEVEILKSVAFYLKKFFATVVMAENGQIGLERYNEGSFDIVISDIQMPGLNGIEMLSEIKKINPDQEMIVFSAYTDAEYFRDAIRLGVSGYVIKPVNLNELNRTLFSSLSKLTMQRENREYKENLEVMVKRRTEENLVLEGEKFINFEKTLLSLVKMIEARDTYTGGHSQRVATYSKMIAEQMEYSKEECDLIYRAGMLHDIGKMTTPDTILLKPGKLLDIEYRLIQEHAKVGYQLLVDIPMYSQIAKIIRHHHEHFDGSGYPDGLKGDEISELSQIMIVADAFDAMTTNRIYKGRKSVPEALQELEDFSGSQFHPNVVKAALIALSVVKPLDTISQEPISEIEQQRFSYFYRDQMTRAFNYEYLDFVLNTNFYKNEFTCINIIYLHDFGQYNDKHGWTKGNELLATVVEELYSRYGDVKIFRIHGDDFVMINKKHVDVDLKAIQNCVCLKGSGIGVSAKHIDLKSEPISSFEELEKKL
jgi:putative nucleotidyltransferase with HDIG domain